MSTTLQAFQQDHSTALARLEALQRAARAIREGASLQEVLPEISHFSDFMEHALKVHFRQEEQALFPVLGEVIGHEGGPIAQMLIEHKEIQENHCILRRESTEQQPDRDMIVLAASRIVEILAPHIQKEDYVLFPMAQRALSKVQLDRIDELAAQIGVQEESDVRLR
ncbi:MAG: hemerythrin domain-containing protein [Firmicutes bacterium]|nr:hemerythrin domain-containing protein [Bacillota bacterium]